MTPISYIVISLLTVAAIACVVCLVRWRRRKAVLKAREEELRKTNQPLRVWLCRQCGFTVLMRSEECTWCGAPRPEDFMFRTIRRKDFTAQLKKPAPAPYTDGMG